MKLLKFYAPWCGPCKVLSKKLAGFDLCDVIPCNIEDGIGETLVEKYGVKSVPTLVLTNDNGDVLKTWCGLVDIGKLKSEIKSMQ